MKKIVFLLMVLVVAALSGCGEYEDETPSVVWTSPANGEKGVTESGEVLVVQFSTPMIASTINMGTVTVTQIGGSTSWPSNDGATPPVATTSSVTTEPSDDLTMFTFSLDNFLPSNSCFRLEVSAYVRSEDGKSMDAPYTSCFCTDLGDGTCP